jgi:hypothetical protein
VLGVFVSGHKFYVCDFRTKHKICILAYHNLCFCVFVFLGMLQYVYEINVSPETGPNHHPFNLHTSIVISR